MSDLLEFIFLPTPQEAPKPTLLSDKRILQSFWNKRCLGMQPNEIWEEGGLDRWTGGLARTGTGSRGGKESRGFRWQFLTRRHLPHKTPESKADPPPISVGKVRPKRARVATGAENHGRGRVRVMPESMQPQQTLRNIKFPTSETQPLGRRPLSSHSMSSDTRNSSPASWAEPHVRDTHTHTLARGLSASKVPFLLSNSVSNLKIVFFHD